MTTLRRAGVGDAPDLTRLRALMLSAMGRDVGVPGWVVEVDGRSTSGEATDGRCSPR